MLAHAAVAAGALDLLEVDAVLGGDPHDHRRVAPAARAPDRPLHGLRVALQFPGFARCFERGRGLAGARLGDAFSFSETCASPGRASVAIRAITVPTSTVSPTATTISATRPLAGDSTSVSILSVEIEAMISSAWTQSPTCFFHSTTVPSASGRVAEIVVAVGETVDVGTVMARIATDAQPG